MNPHILEALIGGACTALPMLVIGWLTRRDIGTKLIVKVEEHDRRLNRHDEQIDDQAGRLGYLEGKLNGRAIGKSSGN